MFDDELTLYYGGDDTNDIIHISWDAMNSTPGNVFIKINDGMDDASIAITPEDAHKLSMHLFELAKRAGVQTTDTRIFTSYLFVEDTSLSKNGLEDGLIEESPFIFEDEVAQVTVTNPYTRVELPNLGEFNEGHYPVDEEDDTPDDESAEAIEARALEFIAQLEKSLANSNPYPRMDFNYPYAFPTVRKEDLMHLRIKDIIPLPSPESGMGATTTIDDLHEDE